MTLTADSLRPHQADIIRAALWSMGTRDDERYLLVHGGRGTLKTSTLTRFLAIQLRILTTYYRGYTLLVAAMTHDQLKDVFLRAWEEAVDPAAFAWAYDSVKRQVNLPNGGRIIMRHAADESGSRSAEKAGRKLKGLNAHGFYAPEAISLSAGFYASTQLAVRAVPEEYLPGMPPYRINWLDANPDSPSHWIHRQYLDPSAPEYLGSGRIRVLGFATTPATSVYSAERIAIDRARLPAHEAARMLDDKWVGASGAVIPLYDGAQVTDAPLPPGGDWYWAFDWGFEVDPYVGLLIYSHGGSAMVVDEFAGLRLEHADALARGRAVMQRHGFPAIRAIMGDSGGIAGGGMKELDRWRRALPSRIVSTSKSRYLGWRSLIRAFATPGSDARPLLTVHSRCTGTIASLRSLVWTPKGDDAADVRGDDHADALRYFAMSASSPFEK